MNFIKTILIVIFSLTSMTTMAKTDAQIFTPRTLIKATEEDGATKVITSEKANSLLRNTPGDWEDAKIDKITKEIFSQVLKSINGKNSNILNAAELSSGDDVTILLMRGNTTIGNKKFNVGVMLYKLDAYIYSTDF